MWKRLAALLLVLSLAVTAVRSETCETVGFTGDQLCSSCDKLEDYVKDVDLIELCKSCCVQDETKQEVSRFKKATLEICSYRISEFRNVESFINDHLKNYKNVKLVKIWGSPPKIVLRSGKQQEITRIDGWKTENIIEFLDSRLES